MKILNLIVLSFTLIGCSDSNVVATVGGKDITKEEFNNYLTVKGVTSTSQESRLALIEDYTSRIALASAIEDSGEVELNKIERKVQDYRQQLILNAYFDKYIETNVNGDAVKNYYSENASKFEDIKVHVAHILFRTRKGMTDEEIQVEKMKAYEIKGKINKGEDFSELAKSESSDQLSGKKGGDLGWIKVGSIDPKFSDVAFGLGEGEVSDPFRTTYGFHILKVLEAPKTIKQGFKEVKGQIRHELKAKAKKSEIRRLMGSKKVEIFENNLKAI